MPCRGKKNPAFIRMQQRRRHKRSAAHIKVLDQAEERTYEGVVEASPPPAASPSQPAPRPPPNRSLEFDAQVDPPPDAAAAAPAQEEQSLQITVEEKVADWRRRIESAQEAPDNLNDFDLLVYDDYGQLHVRKDHRNPQGQAPLCYVETGYKGTPAPDSEPHQAYMVYNKNDLRWARRLKFHLWRFQALET